MILKIITICAVLVAATVSASIALYLISELTKKEKKAKTTTALLTIAFFACSALSIYIVVRTMYMF